MLGKFAQKKTGFVETLEKLAASHRLNMMIYQDGFWMGFIKENESFKLVVVLRSNSSRDGWILLWKIAKKIGLVNRLGFLGWLSEIESFYFWNIPGFP